MDEIIRKQKIKYFFVKKNHQDVISIVNKYLLNENSRDDIVRYNNYLRIIASFDKGRELGLIGDDFEQYVEKLRNKIKNPHGLFQKIFLITKHSKRQK